MSTPRPGRTTAARSALRALLPLCLGLALTSCVLPPRLARPGEKQVFHAAHPPPGGARKWNPAWWAGNADDPVPPAWYRPGQRGRATLWQLRNPCHNLTFYIIGVHDRDFVRRGRAPDHVFHPDGGWNFAVIQAGWLRLPFISYQGGRVRFYALWRENGNFGLKLNFKRDERIQR